MTAVVTVIDKLAKSCVESYQFGKQSEHDRIIDVLNKLINECRQGGKGHCDMCMAIDYAIKEIGE